jgi:hypothetical protein
MVVEVSAGSLLDQLIDNAIIAAGNAARAAGRGADRLLSAAAPFDESAAQRYLGADLLAEAEADYEVAEPLGEYPEVPPIVRPVPRQVLINAVCEVLAGHHPRRLPDQSIQCETVDCDTRYHADRQEWREHVSPLIVDNLPNSAPGASFRSAPVAADAPSPAPPPRGAGSGHSTSELLLVAANQVTAFKRGVTDHLLTGYLADLIPELRDRAAQFAAISD